MSWVSKPTRPGLHAMQNCGFACHVPLWNDELGNGFVRKFSSKFTHAVSVGNVKQCAAVTTRRDETAVAEHENCRLRAKPTYGCAPLSSSPLVIACDGPATTSSASAVAARIRKRDFKMTSRKDSPGARIAPVMPGGHAYPDRFSFPCFFA